MNKSIYTVLGVTISFVIGSALTVGAVYELYSFGLMTEYGRQPDNWLALAMAIVGFAALAGVCVDLLRLVGTAWLAGAGRDRSGSSA